MGSVNDCIQTRMYIAHLKNVDKVCQPSALRHSRGVYTDSKSRPSLKTRHSGVQIHHKTGHVITAVKKNNCILGFSHFWPKKGT